MTKRKFEIELQRAQTMSRLSTDPLQIEYYTGYQRGLRRAYHGESFGTSDEHLRWLSLSDKPDELSKERGRGYKEGMEFVKPNIAKINMTIRVPPGLMEQIDERAAIAADRTGLPITRNSWIVAAIKRQIKVEVESDKQGK